MIRNNFRKPPRKSRRRQTVDGILGAPSGPRSVHGAADSSFQRQPLRRALSGRQLDDFKRSDGYHALSQPAMRPQMAHHDTSQLVPSLLNKTFTPDKPLLSALDLPESSPHRHKKLDWRRIRRWTKRTALGIGVLLVVVGGLLVSKGYLKLHKVFGGGAAAAALQANVDPSLLKGEGSGRVNILLLGIGGAGHDGPDLTDTIMLASIDPVNNKVALLSIPRDLWVKMPNSYEGNYQKINAAYEAGKYHYLGHDDASSSNHQAVAAGFQAADQVVGQVLGLSIHYNMLVDFQAFKQAVDSVNGIDVNVPTQLYDPSVAWENNWNSVIAKAGPQTFHGQQALLYVRSRETSSDFARSERQRAVLVALKQKVLSLGTFSNPLKISQLLSAFGDNVVSDLSLSDASRLYSIGKQVSNTNIQSIGLADPPNNYVTTSNINGLSIVQPTAGLGNYTAIQTFVRGALRDGYLTKENAPVTVLNGTATAGLATQVAATLKSYGYNVGTVGDAPTHAYAKTVVVDLSGGSDKYTKHYLEQRYHVSAVNKLPDSTIQPGVAKFVIIVGQDAATNS